MRHLAKILLREPASQGWAPVWLKCPKADDRQGLTDLTTLASLLEVMSSGNHASWRPLCSEAPEVAWLTEWLPEDTEEDRAPYAEMCTTPPQWGLS